MIITSFYRKKLLTLAIFNHTGAPHNRFLCTENTGVLVPLKQNVMSYYMSFLVNTICPTIAEKVNFYAQLDKDDGCNKY